MDLAYYPKRFNSRVSRKPSSPRPPEPKPEARQTTNAQRHPTTRPRRMSWRWPGTQNLGSFQVVLGLQVRAGAPPHPTTPPQEKLKARPQRQTFHMCSLTWASYISKASPRPNLLFGCEVSWLGTMCKHSLLKCTVFGKCG